MPKFVFVAWWQFMALLLCSAVPLGSFAIVPIKVGGKYGANLLKFEYILVLRFMSKLIWSFAIVALKWHAFPYFQEKRQGARGDTLVCGACGKVSSVKVILAFALLKKLLLCFMTWSLFLCCIAWAYAN